MSVRRLHPVQPASFSLTAENLEWAKRQIGKYPEGRQASAVIPILWRAQEQHEGWLPEPAIRYVADMLDMPYIRVLEVATFYTMFQLQPVGKKAHVQVCGTTPCRLRGAGELIKVCKTRIAELPHELSENGDFSWEEVECLGACVNAPMVQVFKDTYEDLDPEIFETILDEFAAGRTPKPGPQNGRYSSEPAGGVTTLTDVPPYRPKANGKSAPSSDAADTAAKTAAGPNAKGKPASRSGAKARLNVAPAAPSTAAPSTTAKPELLTAPRETGADDLKLISGVGPKLEKVLNDLGIYHFDQIAKWTAEEIAWVDDNLKFKGRIERDDWMAQAETLAAGGETDFSRRGKKKSK